MTEFESLFKAYHKARSHKKRNAAFAALYEHCSNNDKLDTLFEALRNAKTDQERSDVFDVLFELRYNGKLDLSRIPEDLSGPCCMLYDDSMFEICEDECFYEGGIQFYFQDCGNSDSAGTDDADEKEYPVQIPDETRDRLAEQFGGMYFWQDPIFKPKFFVLNESKLVCFVELKYSKRTDVIPLTNIDRVERVKNDGTYYVIVFDKTGKYVFIRQDRFNSAELVERINELKEIADRTDCGES